MEKRTSEIVKATLAAHEACEALNQVVKRAVADTRFKLSLADHRHFRDLCDDMTLILNEAWRESIKIPADLNYRVVNKITAKVEK